MSNELNPTTEPASRPTAINPIMASVIRGRRTIGAFQAEVPPRAIVLEALELVRWAPNHKKTEPWHVFWLGPETVRSVIALNTRIIAAAKGVAEADSKAKKWARTPGWLIITCDLASDPFRREEDYAACCCAIQNLQLALWSAGIGTKWATGDVIRHPDFHQLLGIDGTRQRVVGLVWYGYPAVIPEQTRKPIEEYLQELA